jgi:hypothetical protein
VLVESRFHPGWQPRRLERGPRDLRQRDIAIGADDRKLAVGEFEIGFGGFEQMTREPFSFVDDFPGREG